MSLTLQSLKPQKGARRRKMRKGRGIAAGQGASCGFGMRGQKSRSGRPTRPGFEGGQMPLYRRVPKRGFTNARFRTEYTIINVRDLEAFDSGSVVDLDAILAKGLTSLETKLLKVLGMGELTKKLTVKAQKFSKSAVEKIVAAGGEAIVLGERANADSAPEAPKETAVEETPDVETEEEAGETDA